MSNAKNVRVKPVEIEIDGVKHQIKYDFNAFIELEEIYGSIEEAMGAVQGEVIKDKDGKPEMVEVEEKNENGEIVKVKVEKRKFSLKAMRDFLWSGMLFGNSKITKREVGKLLEFGNFQYVVTEMMKAITGALPEKVDDEKN